jgi:hypothetical protein
MQIQEKTMFYIQENFPIYEGEVNRLFEFLQSTGIFKTRAAISVYRCTSQEVSYLEIDFLNGYCLNYSFIDNALNSVSLETNRSEINYVFLYNTATEKNFSFDIYVEKTFSVLKKYVEFEGFLETIGENYLTETYGDSE